MPTYKILVVDDDIDIRRLVTEALKAEGYQVLTTCDIAHAKLELKRDRPDLIVLDIQLPDDSGFNLCQEIRKERDTAKIPILFVSGKKRSLTDRVLGLKLGGDDYLLKPFEVPEFLARIEALLRRARPSEEQPQEVLEEGVLKLDLTAHQAYLKGKPLKLWPKEFTLLQAFLGNKNRLLNRAALYEAVWDDPGDEGSSRQVDFLVHRLRQKLGPLKDRIVPVRGLGYRFEGEK